MKVLIVNNMAPFIWGGAEELAHHLQRNLVLAGHEAEILRIPFRFEPVSCIPSQMLMVRTFELSKVDRVIALKFPAYLIRHSHKSLWLLHQYRQAYDLFDIDHTNLSPDAEGECLRRTIRDADNESFLESSRIFTNSSITQHRLKKYNGFDAEVLPPPVNDPELFCGGDSRGYIFAGGRINGMKRQYLLLEALAKTNPFVQLIIAGPPDTPADADRLHQLLIQFGLLGRVKLDLRFLPKQEYADYVNHAAAVAYLPFDEDSLGYVAMEAATAGKALITTEDSGGVLGLVRNGETGWVVSPTADSLAIALNEVFHKQAQTRAYGKAVKRLWESMGVNWSKTVEKLLQ